MKSSLKTVWILGAGFSRAVGGPLLTQLLSATSAKDLELRFEEAKDLFSGAAQHVRFLYRYGLVGDGFAEVGQPLQNLWRDAEEYIEYVDSASEDPKGPLGRRLDAMLQDVGSYLHGQTPPTLTEVRACGRRLIGAECCSFLIGANTKAERWDPYREWAGKLTREDTIVTFNYDRVLESLDGPLLVGPPGTDWAAGPAQARVLKLHGSVDWVREDDGRRYRAHDDPNAIVSLSDDKMAIATPGPAKRGASRELVELWNLATNALREADVIVFVGYRFPPSDAEARSKILGAIRENKARSKHLRLNIVLGPDRTADVSRLEQMLRAVCSRPTRAELARSKAIGVTWLPELDGSFDITTHAMWAEDFFSVWSRGLIEEALNEARLSAR